VLINTVFQLKKYHSTDGINSSYIALTVKYLRLHVKSSCRIPKPIEDECVLLDNARGGYSTAANWTTTIWLPASNIREAGSQSVNLNVIRVQMRKLIAEQTKAWSDMILSHVTEVYELRKTHIQQEIDVLRQILPEMQQQQIKELEQRQERFKYSMCSLVY